MNGPAAIIAAGGTGSRSASATPKQFRLLGGKRVLEWSLDVLLDAGCDPVVLAVPASHLSEVQAGYESKATVVSGGPTRQASVAAALKSVHSALVLVHDGARPLITPDLVRDALAAIGDLDGVVVAMPMDETLKRVADDVVVETVDRDDLWRVQTPQVFRTPILREAHERAAAEGWSDAVDDAALIERIGGRIGIVQGARSNLKITLPEDFLLAEAMVAGKP